MNLKESAYTIKDDVLETRTTIEKLDRDYTQVTQHPITKCYTQEGVLDDVRIRQIMDAEITVLTRKIDVGMAIPS